MTPALICPDAFLSPLEIDATVMRALAEDLGRAGDVTSIATIPEGTPARALVVARAAGVIAGLPLVAAVFRRGIMSGKIGESCQGGRVQVVQRGGSEICRERRTLIVNKNREHFGGVSRGPLDSES